jgi:hypothetical protein
VILLLERRGEREKTDHLELSPNTSSEFPKAPGLGQIPALFKKTFFAIVTHGITILDSIPTNRHTYTYMYMHTYRR